jgi:flagellar basal body-associated protein FliL
MRDDEKKVLIIGAVVGALAGMAVAWSVTHQKKQKGNQVALATNPVGWFKLIANLVALLRQFSSLLEP